MASRRTKLVSIAGLGVAIICGYALYSALAAQGQGVLAQAPLNNQVQVPPAFIMAVDDSGSMSFHNQFPARDGYACWNDGSFFSSEGDLRTSGTCSFAYSYTGPRIGTGYYGIPPVDTYGFARSSDFNPAYFDPTIRYEPWVEFDGTPYPQAAVPDTLIDPRGDDTIELASWVQDASSRSRFQTLTGMVLPKGTHYRTVSSGGCGGLTGGDWHEVTSANGHTMTSNCAVYIRYWPATFYTSWDNMNDPWPELEGSPGVYDSNTAPRERILHACGTGCHLWRYRIQPGTQAHRNFANWFTYYGNRNRAMIAGMTRSMATVNNMRVGYFQINQHSSFDQPLSRSNERVWMRDMGDFSPDGDRAQLYTSMIGLPASGGTPNRQAVYAAGQQLKRTDDERGGAPIQLACQRNAIMLFTDGYSNNNGPEVGNVDGGMGAPFEDEHSNTMADIAALFYNNQTDDEGNERSPLRSDLPAGQVSRPTTCPSSDPKVNCQNNLHANFYGVTLGGRGNLYDPVTVPDPYTTPAIYANWPSRQNDNRSTIDDIWHATVNTRGEFVNARTPAEITDAMRRILAQVNSGASPSGTLALTGARIGAGSLSVEPYYEVRNEGTDWFSTLKGFSIESDLFKRVVSSTEIWEASEKLPSASSRTIFFGTDAGASPFTASEVGSLDMLCNSTATGMSRCNPASSYFGNGSGRIDVSLSQAISYLRGDTSREVRNGGNLRDRGSRLGSIINSPPVISAPTDDYGYRSLAHDNLPSSYSVYLEDKKDHHYSMVYVGANDGMLHAFHGGTNADGDIDLVNGGVERFAYIPQSVLGHMGNLLFPYDAEDGGDQKFQHRYFVDGPIAVSDAHYGGSWSTVLVGTAGAGGRSVFALDVARAARGSGSGFSQSDRLWEINDRVPGAVGDNIGHVLGKPVIVPVKGTDGQVSWKAIFGNGYNSRSNRAVLFVVDIDSANPEIRMIVAEESDPPAGSNGLGNLVVVDRWGGPDMTTRLSDGFADTVYAADQRGAVWKFDLRSSAAVVSSPLFTTQTHDENEHTFRQPILGGLTAAAGPGGGVMLYFGTGSFSFVGDSGDTRMQSLYGILDRGDGVTLTISDLQQQSITQTRVDGSRVVTTDGLAPGRRGWYLNLPAGERAVGYPRVESGVVFIPTYTPAPDTGGCSTEGFNSLFGLNALSGGAGLSQVSIGSPSGPSPGAGTGAIPLETQGTAPVKDVAVMTMARVPPLEAGSDPDDLADALEGQCSMIVQVAGAPLMYLPRACGRQSWRQIQ